MDVEQVCRIARRPAVELTRRDVARALLTEPAAQAVDGLPALRRDLVAAGNPLTIVFWDGAEAMLIKIASGEALLGEVRAWLAATGTEPEAYLPELLHAWPEEDEIGPVATEMHARLVAHLESLVADGTIDPDRLAAGDPADLTAYRQHQADWLTTPLPDGRVPYEAVQDEQDEDFLTAWDDAEQDAREALDGLLAGIGERALPAEDLASAAARLRVELRQDPEGTALLRAVAGVQLNDLPQDDADLWLTLAAGVVGAVDEPPPGEFGLEVLSAWASMLHPEWIAIAAIIAREGPGSSVEADHLAGSVAEFDFAALDESDADGAENAWFEDGLDDDTGAMVISIGLLPVLRLWRQLGAVDHDDTLTALGWWGIPESVSRAWRPVGANGQE